MTDVMDAMALCSYHLILLQSLFDFYISSVSLLFFYLFLLAASGSLRPLFVIWALRCSLRNRGLACVAAIALHS